MSELLTSDDIFDLIAAHASSWARFGRSIGLTDEDEAKVKGRKITKADRAEYEAANQGEIDALNALLAAPCRGTQPMRVKALWIQLWAAFGNNIDADQLELLLQSMVDTRGPGSL